MNCYIYRLCIILAAVSISIITLPGSVTTTLPVDARTSRRLATITGHIQPVVIPTQVSVAQATPTCFFDNFFSNFFAFGNVSISTSTIDGRTVRVSPLPMKIKQTRATEVALANARLLDVTNFNGSVEVVGWDKPMVKIEVIIRAVNEKHLDDLRMEEKHTDDSITIKTRLAPECQELGSQISYRIFAPHAMQTSNLVTSNGAIVIKGVTGSVKLRTSNGGIHLENIGGNVFAGTSNGAVEAQDIGGSAKFSSSNGSLTLANIMKGINATTSNGTISLRLSNSVHVQISADTSNGSISVNPILDVKYTTRSKNYMSGSIGDGTHAVDLSTSNGTITIR